jgi:hypothetical protein
MDFLSVIAVIGITSHIALSVTDKREARTTAEDGNSEPRKASEIKPARVPEASYSNRTNTATSNPE